MSRVITVSCVLNVTSGYGQFSCEVIAGLAARGWDVSVKPIRIEESVNGIPAPVPIEIMDRVEMNPSADTELLISPLDRPSIPTPGKRTFYFSLWEATKVSPKQASIMNRADVVLTAGKWQAKAFAAGGVTRPIRLVPLGISPEIFIETPMSVTGKCVFGAGGCMAASRERKRLTWIAQVFQAAFRNEEDVELRLKILPGETLDFDEDDPRIRCNAEFTSWVSLARWLQGLNVFVNAGVEGWGLFSHQAMACGRPVMAMEFGGSIEFFDREVGYPISHFTHWNSIGDRSLGAFALPDFQSAVEQMRRVYLDRTEAAELGRKAAERARQFNWENTINKLEEALTA